MSNRMTQQSKANVEAAERAELIPAETGGYLVKVWRGEKTAFVHGSETILIYSSADLARRAVKRLNPSIRLERAPSI